MLIPERYVVRMLNIPETMTRSTLESQLSQHNIPYVKLHFASQDGVTSAGFVFIEFKTRQDMALFKMQYHNINEDILYNNGKM